MSLDFINLRSIRNQQGFGLIAAIFIIVVLALFGLLVARFTGTSSVSSAEDYLWAQAYYSAQSGIRLRILQQDGGGGFGVFSYPTIAQFTLQEIAPPTLLQGTNLPSTLRVRAARGTIIRVIEAKYVL